MIILGLRRMRDDADINDDEITRYEDWRFDNKPDR
jgi:hypothetical protein